MSIVQGIKARGAIRKAMWVLYIRDKIKLIMGDVLRGLSVAPLGVGASKDPQGNF